LLGLLVFLGWPLPQKASKPAFSRVVQARDGSLLRAYLSPDEKWRFRVDSDELPPHLTEGLLCLEDQYFRSHPGVNPLAVGRALAQNFRFRQQVSGASTLTMQVARLIEPAPRVWSNKIREALRAFRLEAQLSKKEILNLYFSYAPFGGNLEGIESAAQRYFGKSARLLSAAESAFLLLLPQSPRRWSQQGAVNLKKLRDGRLKRFAECGVLGSDELQTAMNQPIPEWRGNFQMYAGHVSDWALGLTNGDRIVTTIDFNMQKSLEELASAQEAELRAAGILNIGVVAVDNETGEILAGVGNFDIRRAGDAQQFNSLLVPRSTGSLLKTFLYARLLESGDLLPESLMEDVPLEFNGYRPENYSGEFQGLVEARMALAHSLNVPWIKALKDYGVDAFMAHLLSSGLRSPQKPSDVGVSMAVGGLQANLADMVMLYRSVAADGEMRPLTLIQGESARPPSWSWMHPGAAHLVREALKIRGRPDFAIDPRHLVHSRIRWKTGTSQGNRDAWAIGFDPSFTVGVWLGNLDQRAVPALVGPEVSAPIMFDAFSRLKRQALSTDVDWYATGTESVEVCSFSGLPRGPACPHTKSVLGLKGLAMRTRCPYHQDILIDAKSGLRITRECEGPDMRAQVRSVLDLTPDAAEWTRAHLPGLELSPRFHPACLDRPVARGGLQILSPQSTSYVLHKAEGGDRLNIPLRLKTAQASANWRCFLNGASMTDAGAAGGIGTLISVPPGDHSLLCSDEQGRSDQVEFSVEL
jgi:penicillin-binding protein 1C